MSHSLNPLPILKITITKGLLNSLNNPNNHSDKSLQNQTKNYQITIWMIIPMKRNKMKINKKERLKFQQNNLNHQISLMIILREIKDRRDSTIKNKDQLNKLLYQNQDREIDNFLKALPINIL